MQMARFGGVRRLQTLYMTQAHSVRGCKMGQRLPVQLEVSGTQEKSQYLDVILFGPSSYSAALKPWGAAPTPHFKNMDQHEDMLLLRLVPRFCRRAQLLGGVAAILASMLLLMRLNVLRSPAFYIGFRR